MKLHKEQYLQRDAFIFIFPVQALSVGLPAINLLASNIMIGKFVGEVGLAAVGFLSPLNKLVSIFAAMLSTGLQILLFWSFCFREP